MSFNDPLPGNDNILHVIVSNIRFKLLLLTVKQKLPALSVIAAGQFCVQELDASFILFSLSLVVIVINLKIADNQLPSD